MKHLKSCKYCGRIHDISFDCGMKPKYYAKKGNDIDIFHWSKAWEKKSKAIKERDNYLCLVCLSKKIYENKTLSTHHIVPLKEDWERRLDDDNLITLCRVHHEQAESNKISRKKLFELVKSNKKI